MKMYMSSFLAAVVAIGTIGCTAEVKTTDDSTKIEVEAPKLEIGEKPVDLDPTTDEDVDIDTPAPGDK